MSFLSAWFKDDDNNKPYLIQYSCNNVVHTEFELLHYATITKY